MIFAFELSKYIVMARNFSSLLKPLIYYIMYTPKDIFNKVLKLDRVGLNYSERTTFFSASRHSMFLI